MYDYHIHSKFSQDSYQSLEQICKRAVELGIKEIAITDHIDIGFPGGDTSNLQYEEYKNEINEAINDYKDILSVILGIEVGIQPNVLSEVSNYVTNNRFDFVIASIHAAGDYDIKMDNYHMGKNQREAYEIYLNDLINCLKNFRDFNILGHLDIIIRYGSYQNKKLEMSSYGDAIDQILRIIIQNGKGIEVNTSGYRYGLGDMHPSKEIIKRYRELGGEIITVGSDAHCIEHIGYRIDEVYEYLKDIGFKYITTFRNREPQFIKL